jgi:hypothetical protein
MGDLGGTATNSQRMMDFTAGMARSTAAERQSSRIGENLLIPE